MALLSASIVASSCGLDNRVAPESKVLGRVVYNGQQIGVRGTGEAVQLQFFQDGYQLRNPIPVYVGQDGTFEAKLADGQYKMVTRDNNGPWVNTRDTTVINLKGTANVDLQVTPLFNLSNVSISLSGNSVNASFQVDQVTSGWNIDYAMILVSRTSFVDDVANIGRREIKGITAGTSRNESLDLSAISGTDGPLFARVGVRAAGKDQAIYSQVVKLR